MNWWRRLCWRIYRWRFGSVGKTELTLEPKIIKGNYPNNLRYVKDKKHLKVVIVEAMPGKRMILAENKPVCLYFPYVYFIVSYAESISPLGKSYVVLGMDVGFSENRIESTNAMISRLPLSNYAGLFSFCLGTGLPSHGPYESIKAMVESHINSFWRSSFEMTNLYFDEWADATKRGMGDIVVNKLIEQQKHRQNSIASHIGVPRNEQFFEYQIEPDPDAKLRSSGNRPNRRKRREGASRKT